MLSIEGFLRLMQAHCSPPYFSRESYSNVLKTTRRLPATSSRKYMFERSLQDSPAPIDFSFLVRDCDDREVLAGTKPGFSSDFYETDPWRRIREFSRGWLSDSPTLSKVRSLWLEFDVRSANNQIPIPLVFFTMRSGPSPEPAMNILQDTAFNSNQMDTFRRCWDAIPKNCAYLTAGLLYSRSTEAIRLIFITTPDEAFQYLERIDWPGSILELAKLTGRFLSFHGEIALHIDAYPQGVGAQAGMEIYPDRETLYFGRGGNFASMISAAIEESLCPPELGEALLAWPGSEKVGLGAHTIQIDRMFHHLKLVTRPGALLHAKAYTTAECEVLS